MRPAREQPNIHAQTYVNMIDHGLDIQTSPSRRPRWLSGRFALGEARDTLHIEARFPGETISELERRGSAELATLMTLSKNTQYRE